MPPVPVRRAALAAAAAAFALLCWFALVPGASGAWAAPGDHKFITLRGRVADATGAPVPDVRIEANGTREGIALTNADGRFNLTLDLGTLLELRRRPVALSVKARRAGHRILVSGGAPELALELQLAAEAGTPVLRARSNFGIIADALLESLAPAGDRTAVIQVRFVAEPGIQRDSSVTLPELPRSVPIAESWVVSETPAPARTTAPARATETARPPAEPATVPPVRVEPKPPVVREESRTPVVRAQPGRVKRATERRKDEAEAVRDKPAPPVRATAVTPSASARLTRSDSLRITREAEQRSAIAAAESRRDSAWRVQRAESMARKAVTDSLRTIRDAAEDSARRARFGLPPRPAAPAVAARPPSASDARKAQEREAKRAAKDQQRAARLRAEDEDAAREHDARDEQRAARLRADEEAAAREHDAKDEKRAAKLRADDEREARERAERAKQRAPRERAAEEKSVRPAAVPAPPRAAGSADPARVVAPEPARSESQPYAPTVTLPPATSGLRRVEPRSDQAQAPGAGSDARALLEADTCGCVVRGTIEMEFHRLLTSPMRVEVSIRELPALSDTIELFMGSPRAFEMARVPCGRWSLAVRPFSERPFGVTSPEEVAPFDCRQRALRQVRIVIAPSRTTR